MKAKKAKAIVQVAGGVAVAEEPRRVFGTRRKKPKVDKRDIYRGGIKRFLENSVLSPEEREMVQSYWRGKQLTQWTWRGFCGNPECACALSVHSKTLAMDPNLRCKDCA